MQNTTSISHLANLKTKGELIRGNLLSLNLIR